MPTIYKAARTKMVERTFLSALVLVSFVFVFAHKIRLTGVLRKEAKRPT